MQWSAGGCAPSPNSRSVLVTWPEGAEFGLLFAVKILLTYIGNKEGEGLLGESGNSLRTVFWSV